MMKNKMLKKVKI